MRILIVEDEKKLIDILSRGLKAEGYAVDGAATTGHALDHVKAYSYDLLIIDLHLPDGTGAGFLKRVRELGHATPALILTARSDLESKVEVFQAGADDYVVKPVAMAELVLRVKALLRRGAKLDSDILSAQDIQLNRLTRQVKRAGKPVELSPKEYALLEYLFLNAGRTLSRAMIVEKIWDQSFEGLTSLVDVHVSHLRRKIDEGREKKLIRTVRGLGYVFDNDA